VHLWYNTEDELVPDTIKSSLWCQVPLSGNVLFLEDNSIIRGVLLVKAESAPIFYTIFKFKKNPVFIEDYHSTIVTREVLMAVPKELDCRTSVRNCMKDDWLCLKM